MGFKLNSVLVYFAMFLIMEANSSYERLNASAESGPFEMIAEYDAKYNAGLVVVFDEDGAVGKDFRLLKELLLSEKYYNK